MAGGKLDIHIGGSLSKSIDVHMPDFQTDIQLTGDTVNATSGIVEGIGPRYGFSPLPGHMDQEPLAQDTGIPLGTAGIMLSELYFGSVAPNQFARTKIYAIIPIRMGGANAAINTQSTYYALLIQYTYSANTYFDLVFLSTSEQPARWGYGQSSNFYSGLSGPIVEGPVNLEGNIFLGFSYVTQSKSASTNLTYLENYASIAAAINYASSTVVTVNGQDNSASWLVAANTTNGALNTAPKATFDFIVMASATFGAGSGNVYGGTPPQINYGTFSTNIRTSIIYGFKADGTTNGVWSATFAPSASNFNPVYKEGAGGSTAEYDLSALTSSMITTPADYTLTKFLAVNDPAMSINSSYRAVLAAAGGKSFCYLIQDWYRNLGGQLPQVVDLTNMPRPTIQGSATYTENGAPIKTCFAKWPAFTDGTACAGLADLGMGLGGANSGLLRANTVYEFAYSLYDKRLNYETNVGAPARVQTDVTDFVALNLVNKTSSNFALMLANSGETLMPWIGDGTYNTAPVTFLNYLEYRFYYRQLGMSEWIPALFVDAVQWWFYPYFHPLRACTGGQGGSIGGRPGGWQDFSDLPADQYDCVISYKNRAFWMSAKAMQFSLPNNPLAYPTRNSVAAPSGEFRGALVRAYYGQAAQDAQLVVFTTTGTYVGKFTGVQIEVNVQISTTNSATLPLDGSDFILNPWTSVTAFSYRAAVVAEGILYFWGPQGVFQDDGVNPITRISVPLESNIFTVYDPSQTDAVCCTYNDAAKEVWWFYTPKVPDSTYPTYCLVWNRVKNSWLYGKIPARVDAAQTIKIDTSIGTGGTRTLTFCRHDGSATIQRAYFFDQRNFCGDMLPTTELMVKAISMPSTGVRRLTLAAGYTGANFNTVAVGDLIALQQCSSYAGSSLSTPSDFIATVNAVNHGAGTVDITLPTGATLDGTATIANNYNFFPVWHATTAGRGLHGISYEIDTKFWVPQGMAYWAYWLYLHLVFKLYSLLPGTAPTVALNYQTPISVGNQVDTLTLSNNSQGNFQILHPLVPGSSNFEGQGLKLTFSGIQLAGSWVLQFLEAYAQIKDGMQLKIFEG